METKEKRAWLLSVLQGKADREEVVRGYLKHYALPEKPLRDMLKDFVFQLGCKPNIAGVMVDNVKTKIRDYAEGTEERG